MSAAADLLELQEVSRSFAGVPALRAATFDVRAAEVHAVVGENGAGKSTMMKIITGALRPDSGVMRWRGEPVAVAHATPREAATRGIGLAHQEPVLAPHLTVAQNLFLGHEPMRGLRLDHAALDTRARALFNEYGLPLDPVRRASELTAAERQLLELARGLVTGTALLILDEPTSSLSEKETELVMRAVATVAQRGTAVVYISHRLDEVRRVAQRATILRDGRTVHSGEVVELSTTQIIRHMAGREVMTERAVVRLRAGVELLRVEALGRRGAFRDVSFQVRAGEIVGVAGLVGAGRTELCEALFGIRPADSGAIYVRGRAVSIGSPQDARRAGLALLTEDRQRTGLLQGRPLSENITVAALASFSPRGLLRRAAERSAAARLVERLRIRGRPEQRVETLSGGNQQKALIARWMLTQARVLLFDEPTRGIDVGAKAEVFALMEELARQGAGVLMVSSEIPELLQVADRLLVMRRGALVTELGPSSATREEVLRWAL